MLPRLKCLIYECPAGLGASDESLFEKAIQRRHHRRIGNPSRQRRLHFFYRRLAGGPDDIHDLTLEVSKGGAERVVRLAPPPVPQTFQHRFMNLTRSSLSGQITPRGFAPRTPLHARSRGPHDPHSARVGSLARSFASRTGFKTHSGWPRPPLPALRCRAGSGEVSPSHA